jgi:DNA-binding beta-propeller fold protein YncE
MASFSRRAVARASGLVFLAVAGLVPGGTAAGASRSPGDQAWAVRFNGLGSLNDGAVALAVNPGGTAVYVTGSTETGPVVSPDYATIAYDATTGGTLWGKTYNGPGASGDAASDVAVGPDGSSVYVTGYSNGGASGSDYATIAYKATNGALLWGKRYNAPANSGDTGKAVAVSPDGTRVFVTGFSSGSTTDLDYATIAYDAGSGATVWTKRYNGPGNGSDAAYDIAVSPDGTKVYVSGGSFGVSSSSDYATVAYDAASGTPVWLKRYNGPGNASDTVNGITVIPDGSKVVVTGNSAGTSSTMDDYATIAYDATTGAPSWLKRYNGPANGTELPYSVTASPDSTKVFVTGYSIGSATSLDIATIGYAVSTGAVQWVTRYDGPAHAYETGYAVTPSPDGTKVFVTGNSYSSTTFDDYITLAYDSGTGMELWKSFYDGPGAYVDGARAVGASPDGSKVFVTGTSYGTTLTYDVATVSYET